MQEDTEVSERQHRQLIYLVTISSSDPGSLMRTKLKKKKFNRKQGKSDKHEKTLKKKVDFDKRFRQKISTKLHKAKYA